LVEPNTRNSEQYRQFDGLMGAGLHVEWDDNCLCNAESVCCVQYYTLIERAEPGNNCLFFLSRFSQWIPVL